MPFFDSIDIFGLQLRAFIFEQAIVSVLLSFICLDFFLCHFLILVKKMTLVAMNEIDHVRSTEWDEVVRDLVRWLHVLSNLTLLQFFRSSAVVYFLFSIYRIMGVCFERALFAHLAHIF